MPEPLKNQFGLDIPIRIAKMISAKYSSFDSQSFIRDALNGYELLGLTQRGWQIAQTLHRYLPGNYVEAISILIDSLGPKNNKAECVGMAPFLYMPHVFFVAKYGLNHFEVSMLAQYELTQRFTAEFSIRPFLERYTQETFAQLKQWANDPNVHVRRLVSEGTRPRLPWAPRLKILQKDPSPVLRLLELLKDDPELYVRRSVANNLNDIGKDNPSIFIETANRWMEGATKERCRLVRHALRSAIKRRDTNALKILGFSETAKVSLDKISISPGNPKMGGKVVLSFQLTSTVSHTQDILVDYCVHFMKSNGKTSPKIFKLKTINIKPKESVLLKKSVSLANMTTRKHYPGKHIVDIILNGKLKRLGEFKLCKLSR